MNFAINPYSYNINFCSAADVNKIMTTMIKANYSYSKIIEESGLSDKAIKRWLLKYDKKIDNPYKKEIDTIFRQWIIEYVGQGNSVAEAAEFFQRNINWINEKLGEKCAVSPDYNIDKIMENNVPLMIENGFTYPQMEKELRIPINLIRNWVTNTYGGLSIKEIRQLNKTHYFNIEKRKRDELKSTLENFFLKKHYTVTRVAREMGLQFPLIYKWTEIFGIEIPKQKNKEKIYALIEAGFSDEYIARKLRINKITVRNARSYLKHSSKDV